LTAPVDFLKDETRGGWAYYLQRAGLGPFMNDLLMSPSGRYRFVVRSKSVPVTQSEYFTLGIEAYLFSRSGKDELGYFISLR
jgi:hypothetical protein